MTIDNFILIKYIKSSWDVPHVNTDLNEWNAHHEMMFRSMLEQLHFFYPRANIHVLTNEKQKNAGNLVWHYHPELEENHSAKLELYGLLDVPAMYIDSDILIVYPFQRTHLVTKHPFNLFQYSHKNIRCLSEKLLDFDIPRRQYNCGMIWIQRPNPQIVIELKEIRKFYFNNKKWIEGNFGWFNNDEHPVTYFIYKYEMHMRLFKEVSSFRNRIRYSDIFNKQSIHYTGIKHKAKFVKEYRELCAHRVRLF